MASDLVIERLEGECEEFHMFPTLLGRSGVVSVDAAGESFRSSDGIEFSLTKNRLEVYGADASIGFSEVRAFLGLIGWLKARVSGDAGWVKKVLCSPGNQVEFVVDGGDLVVAVPAQKIDFADEGSEPPPLPYQEPEVVVEPEVVDDPVVVVEVVVEPEVVAEAEVVFEPEVVVEAVVEPEVETEPEKVVIEREVVDDPWAVGVATARDMPALFGCDALSKGLISVEEEPELVEARACVGRYLRRLGFEEHVEARAYISMQNDVMREFMVTFAVL